MRVSHSRGTGRPICNQGWIIATRQHESFSGPSIHYVSNNCIYVRSEVFAGTDSIAIDLLTLKDWLIAGDCAMTLAIESWILMRVHMANERYQLNSHNTSDRLASQASSDIRKTCVLSMLS